MRKTILPFIPVLFLLLFAFSNCSLFKPKIDPVGKEYAVSIQTDALILVAKAGESFSLHSEEVYRLMTRVEQAYEHTRPRYKNSKVTGMWNVMRNPRANRLGRFMADWEKEDVLDEEYIKKALEWVQKDFDILIEIEEKKE